jgi:hypothetical protein
MLRRRHASDQAALLAASALGLHSLRYLLAPVTAPVGQVNRHAYLSWLGPIVAAGLAAVLGGFLARMARARTDHQRARLSTRAATLAAAGTLLAVFVAQESLESLLSGSGLSALAVAMGGGGWVIVPLALGLGAMIALLTRPGAILPPVSPTPRPRPRRTPAAWITPGPLFVVRRRPLGRHLAGRAPPAPLEA